jgi:hypothetical protein
MYSAASDAAHRFWLGAFLALFGIQRAFELWLSARHARALREQGGREFGRGHFPLLIFVHTLFPILLTTEILYAGARPGIDWPFWLAILLAAELLRCWAIASLGTYWNVRIWVGPGWAVPVLAPSQLSRSCDRARGSAHDVRRLANRLDYLSAQSDRPRRPNCARGAGAAMGKSRGRRRETSQLGNSLARRRGWLRESRTPRHGLLHCCFSYPPYRCSSTIRCVRAAAPEARR